MEEKEIRLNSLYGQGTFDVRVDPDEDTVWLTKGQMALLFGRGRSVISCHIKSVYKEGELSEKKYLCIFCTRTFTRKRLYESIMYNLDVIISVDYRVKSTRGNL